MTEHLSYPDLNALVDGELSADQLAMANVHLSQCPSCTSIALRHSLLKSAMVKAGQRHAPASDFQARLLRRLREHHSQQEASQPDHARPSMLKSPFYGWAAVVALLLVCMGTVLVQHVGSRTANASAQYAALAAEACDQHIATLAENSPPEVISSDRHTVKPWFQGKLPFSFNLPDNLPAGTTLDGANLTYIHGQPTAQLLYSIGKHRVSVYLQQRSGDMAANRLSIDRSGFHVIAFNTGDMNGMAVSDVEPARLADLVSIVEHAQR
jgi:anti-sigma factor RsiW